MKLISFARLGTTGFGAAVDGGIVDLSGIDGVSDLRSALEADILDDLSGYVDGRAADLSMAEVQFLPVVPNPSKILCIGLNYLKHKQETGRPDVDHPTVFTRFADSQVGHLQSLVKPAATDRFDFEGEMAIVIGKGGRNIAEGSAFDHIAGYACYNDGSVRDWQRHTTQFTPGKNFPATGAFGPFLVTTDEVGDYTKLSIQTRLNGEVVQDASLSDLLFPVETLVSYCSTFTSLAPGDVIVTGTPGGVGDRRTPPLYMEPGDSVEVEVSGLGVLRNSVVDENAI